jgi:hypothetical protein
MVPVADSPAYCEAMFGILSFYGYTGEREHKIYLAAAPEYGKSELKQRLEREIARAKQHFLEVQYLGIADGATSNWTFLQQHTHRKLIDFFCLPQNTWARSLRRSIRNAERMTNVRAGSMSIARSSRATPPPWTCSSARPHASRIGALGAWTCFTNHRHQMDYPSFTAEGDRV